MPTGTCAATGCESVGALRRGWCPACYQWSKTHDWADPSGRRRVSRQGYASQGGCRADDCEAEGRLARGWCHPCYVWSRDHDWADPSGRKRRDKKTAATLLATLWDAAVSTAITCYTVPGRTGRWNVNIDGQPIAASRAVWILANGNPGEAFVLHKCNGGSGDNGCININHLYLGDNSRNMLDRSDVMRCNLQDNPRAKLTNGEALTIIEMYRRGASTLALASQYGVSTNTVWDLVKGKSWKRLPGRDTA